MPRVSIIVPTCCEADNLKILIPRLGEVLAAAALDAEILVVDDNSPDDTPAICEQLAVQFPLRLEVRTSERGLSSAVVHGLRCARGDILVVMDADLSHPRRRSPGWSRAWPIRKSSSRSAAAMSPEVRRRTAGVCCGRSTRGRPR